MKIYVSIICLLLIGCSVAPQESLETPVSLPPLSEESQKDVLQHIPNSTTFELLPGQETVPDMYKIMKLSYQKETPASLAVLLKLLQDTRTVLEDYVRFYNLTIQAILKVHDDPSLPSLSEIPPSVSLIWSIPIPLAFPSQDDNK